MKKLLIAAALVMAAACNLPHNHELDPLDMSTVDETCRQQCVFAATASKHGVSSWRVNECVLAACPGAKRACSLGRTINAQ